MNPLPIIQFKGTNDPISWHPTNFKKLNRSEDDLETYIASNLATLGLEELVKTNYQYKVIRQPPLPRRNNSTVYPDIVVVREDGELFIIEVKLGSNQDMSNRKAIGQILDYASALSALNKSELASMLNKENLHNNELSLGVLFDHWFKESKNIFRTDRCQTFLKNISQSKINLLLVCDQLPSGVYDFVDDLTTESHLPFSFSAVEVTPFKTPKSDSIMLIPQLKIETTIISRTVVEIKQVGEQVNVNVQPSSAEEIKTKIKKKSFKYSPSRKKLQRIQSHLDEDLIPFSVHRLFIYKNVCFVCDINLPNGGVCGIDINYFELIEKGKGIEVKFIPRGFKTDEEMVNKNQFARDNLPLLRDSLCDIFGEVTVTRETDIPRWSFKAPSSISYNEFDENNINQLAIQIYNIIYNAVDFTKVSWN